jgi:hypothetical protein
MTVEELEIIIRANVTDALEGIKAVTNAVKQAVGESIAPMQRVVTQSRVVGSSMSTSMNQSRGATRGQINELQKLKDQMDDINAKIREKTQELREEEAFQKRIGSFGGQTEDRWLGNIRQELEDLRVQGRQTTAEYISNKKQMESATYAVARANRAAGRDISSSIKQGITALRRFSLALFSIRGAYSAISRIVAQYRQTNDELRASMELTMNAMGSLLAPMIKRVSDAIQYLVIGLALLIKMFTGFDALASVTTKRLQNTTKAAKGLNKQLTSMDEITNLTKDIGTDPMAGLQADLKAMEDFAEKIKEVEKLFEKWEVKKYVDRVRDALINAWEWLKENKDMVIAIGKAIGVAFVIGKIVQVALAIRSVWLAAQLALGAVATKTGLLGIGAVLAALPKAIAIAITVFLAVEVGKKVWEAFAALRELKEKYTDSSWGQSWMRGMRTLINSNFFIPTAPTPRAKGGPVSAQELYMVGERGPELFVPNQSGTIVSNSDLKTGVQTNDNSMEQLISLLAQDKQIVLNVNGRDLAKAVYNDFANEGSRLGERVTIRSVS